MEKSFGSKLLINTLSKLGFSITSEEEVIRFKQSAVELNEKQLEPEPLCEDSFIQWVGDNVDHNLCTLNGNFMEIK